MTVPGKSSHKARKLEETLIQTSHAKLRLATINVRTLVGRNADVTKTVERRRVDVVILQEEHFRNDA